MNKIDSQKEGVSENYQEITSPEYRSHTDGEIGHYMSLNEVITYFVKNKLGIYFSSNKLNSSNTTVEKVAKVKKKLLEQT